MKKNRGVTLIELALVMAILAVIGGAGAVFLRHTFDVWWSTRDVVDIQSSSRAALDEMSTFIRQADETDIIISQDGDSIRFTVGQSEAEWGHSDRGLRYFRSGSRLKRYMKGSTTTLVSGGITDFSVSHSTGPGRFESVNILIEASKGQEISDFSRNIVLRSRMSE